MLNEIDIKRIFNKQEKVNRALITQQKSNHCISLIREKLMLRFKFEEAILIVRDESFHKIEAERPNLIGAALEELELVKEKIANTDAKFFGGQKLSNIIPSYMLLLKYVGLNSQKSKQCCRLRNYSIISSKFLNGSLSKEKFIAESNIQLESISRRLEFYKSSDPKDVIIYILRYDINKK